MVLRKEFHIQGNAGIGQGPSWAFNAFSAHQLARAIAERGLAPTVVTAAAEGAAAGSRGSGWGAAAGAALGIGLVTWAWWKSKPKTLETPHAETNNLSPDHLRCLADPYNTSAECAAVRSALSTLPTTNTQPNAARASTATHNDAAASTTPVGLPTAVTALAEKIVPLSAEAGKENLRAVQDRMIALRDRLLDLLGGDYCRIQPSDEKYPIVRRLILEAISDVLLHLPLTGKDGPKGQRTYAALAMDFRDDPGMLRELGGLLTAAPNLRRITEITQWRSEMYKFEVRVPSDLMGFNLDGAGSGEAGHIYALRFQIFDGGKVLDPNGNNLQLIGDLTVPFDASEPIHVDLTMNHSRTHDIDWYK